ncbi:MAG: Na+:solute symporter [Candidatus Marinimicrobia bacterium]|nr:Na+:solute symporter [Candidatus Neomarinimicrobiota bacterium]MCF7830032.1 Na+:solute symporter [Candidatus Neomarinimicrobiota bacterium]MCF7881926.1 Na+:solute symporter [Candidatus Neomarinimicrobiota bacterium]
MNLVLIDWAVIVTFFAIIFGIAFYYSKRAGKDTDEFFLSGRNMPWWIAGTAMVATTFAADTPLAVTELVAKHGIAGNWLWWNLAIGGMLTVFFFARLWRRAGIMTDVELTEMRYSGKPAAILRGFRAIYLGLFMNAIVLGWVHKAMEKIFHVTLPEVDAFLLVTLVALIIAVYSSAAGLLGTARTDSFQFIFAMIGVIILAVIVVRLPSVGGMAALTNKISPELLDFFPRVGNVTATGVTGGALALTTGAFFAHIGLQWWSSWYPGADPGGGGYIAQRMMSAKDEKHSLFATLWFTIAHYAIRPWPWIVVALAALVILPRGESPEALKIENPAMYQEVVQAYENPGLLKTEAPVYKTREFKQFYEKYENTVDPGVMYPKLMVRYLPAGLLGLLIAVFLAAYMSTIASQLNWGTSYLINDFYRRFFKASEDEKHYVLISRITIILLTIVSLLITNYLLTTISGAWEFIINASAGMGAVLILRWYWWRINAWSEISAMIAPLIIYPIARFGYGMQSPITLYPVVIGTTIVWLAVTFLTKPTSREVLSSFYKKVHPGGIGWRQVAEEHPEVTPDAGYGRLFVSWLFGVVFVYSTLFGIGEVLFTNWLKGGLFLSATVISGIIIYTNMKKQGFETLAE